MSELSFFISAAVVLIGFVTVGQAQTPEILDVSTAIAGSNRIETLYLFAEGKWSDAGDHMDINSTQIHCYKAFGLCEEADAHLLYSGAYVDLVTYDILRWDGGELIAVDSSPICVVNTLRVDFAAKKIATSSTSKGETKDPFCKGAEIQPTTFLTGSKDLFKANEKKTK